MSCLDDSTVLRFVAGRLDEAAYAVAEEELARCGRCAALVAEVVRSSTAYDVGRSGCELPSRERAAAEVEERGGGDDPAERYVLGAVIARGGMGTIFGAFDRRLSRSVAVKCLDSSESVMSQRFAREIRITASLQHPGIVPIYDSGRLPDGRAFYAMRHVPGASLEQEMAARSAVGERLDLLAAVLDAAEAVAYAHDRGIVHRDLKPSNILVGPFGETVVIDWGLARVMEGDAPADDPSESGRGADTNTGDTDATRQGAVLGTPRYMAPEQARGEPASRQSDVYALGAILYTTLSGQPPASDSVVEVVLARVARAEVRRLAELVPGLPGDLVAIVERAMAARADARYANAGELAADLRRFQTGQLVAAHAYSRRDLVRRFVRRHRAAVSLAALFAVVAVAGGTVSVRRIVGERAQAQAQRERAERERTGAEDLVQFLLHDMRGKLTALGRLDVLSGVADRVESYYRTAAAERALSPEVVRERAALHELRAAVATASGDGDLADRHLQQGLELVDGMPPSPEADEVRAALHAAAGLRAARTGQQERARALRLQSAEHYRRAAAADPGQRRRLELEVAYQLTAAAAMADRLGRPADAEREWNAAAEILGRHRAESPEDLEAAGRLVDVKLVVGQSRYRRSMLDEAQRSLEAALADASELAARHPKHAHIEYLVAWSCLSLADVHSARGQHAEAVGRRERALAVARSMLDVEPASARWQIIRARAEASLGSAAAERMDWVVAAKHLESAGATYAELLARDPKNREYRRDAAIASAALAEAESARGRVEPARAAWQATLAHFAALAGSGAPDSRLEWAFGLRKYAAFERRVGRLDAADRAVRQAIEIVDSLTEKDERPVLTYYRAAVFAEAGAVRARQHRAQEAGEAWARAAQLLRGVAAKVPLQSEWERELREVEAELARARSPGRRRR